MLPIAGAEAAGVGSGYRFGFNGQERDDEMKGSGNSYDFGARIYDSRLGRWLSVDPLQQEYPFISPYNFTLNSPVTSIDPDGKRVIVTRIPGEGKDGRDLVIIKVDAKWVDKTYRARDLEVQRLKVDKIQDKESGRYKRAQKKLDKMQANYDAYANKQMEEIKASVESTFNGMTDEVEYQTQVVISNGTSGNIKSDDHVFYAVDKVIDATASANDIGGLVFYYEPFADAFFSASKTKAHEFGHLLGLLHNDDNTYEGKLIRSYSAREQYDILKQNNLEDNVMDYNGFGKSIHPLQRAKIETNFNEGKLNRGVNTYDPNHGSSNKASLKGYEVNYKKPQYFIKYLFDIIMLYPS